ncbi:MAG TPA: hypothetical protein VF517_14865 [Thermoleophilaceae bacterium]|jgi:hypothetical protein
MRRLAPALAAVALVVLPLVGCGDDEGAALGWAVEPRVVQHPEIPGDLLVTGAVRNETDDELRLDSEDARVIGSDGRALRATVRFAAGYSHSLYPPRDAPRETPRQERERLGAAATIPPGGTAPLTAAWHRPRGGVRAVRIEIGDESVPLRGP